MITVERNAAGIDDAYLRGLETCFPGAWTPASYRWYLARRFRSRPPDRLSAHVGSRLVAGVGINYRQIRCAQGIRDVAILTAAWTLPEHRGRGCYARLLDAATRLAADNGCAALLGFVTTKNPSGAGLRRRGAREVRTRYLSLAPGDAVCTAPRQRQSTSPREGEEITFHYANRDEWESQFVDRPGRTTLLESAAGTAVVEHVGRTDRLQYLPRCARADAVVALAAQTCSTGRRFFYFTTDDDVAEHAAANGLRQQAGALMILELRGERWSEASWHVQPGDRM
jgi:GNAT superfamily N-acetyltransferase